ncbi:MAG: hypothetical protein HC784_01750 [Hydrococcus sp. CSU_1_8]|nr:hypothetical protein [Hydrococcus sp. CSU_1_8]
MGIAPVIAWYITQSLHYGMPFAAAMFGQYFQVSGKHSVSLSLSPLIEVAKFSLALADFFALWTAFGMARTKLGLG